MLEGARGILGDVGGIVGGPWGDLLGELGGILTGFGWISEG